ncbi:AAA family ATPase [Roseateles sp. MS654]|uniref:AAA family ATPase n=1 Tax=Roseateles sp. MS654 TaxID=3412685 RepID=UPI003C2B6177
MTALPFTEFSADGFRGLRSLEVKNLRGINVFVGGNNSGKTSVLESIALLCLPATGHEWVHVIRRRDFGRLDESILASLRWCFANPGPWIEDEEDELRMECRFTASGNHPIRTVDASYREFFAAQELADPDGEAEVRSVRNCSITSLLTWADGSGPPAHPARSRPLLISSADNHFLPIATRQLVRRGEHGVAYAALLPYSYQLNTLQVGKRSEQLFLDDDSLLLELMKQFDEDVIRVEVASFDAGRPAIYIKHRQLGVAPLSVFGDAMRRCLLMATTLTTLGRGGVLLLDEIELGIHIDSLPKVVKWLARVTRELGVQVFATTHSLDAVDALLAAEVDAHDLAAYRIKQGDERTECQHFPFDSLKRLRYERGLDIR